MTEFLGGLVDKSKEKQQPEKEHCFCLWNGLTELWKGVWQVTVSDALNRNAQVYSGSKISYPTYGTASKVRREFLSQLLERIVGKSDFSVRFFFLRCSLFCQDNFNSKLPVIILFLNQVEL